MADNQDNCKAISEYSEHILECEHISDNQDIRRQVFGERMFLTDDGQLSGDYYPKTAFVFKERDGRRAESVYWAKYCSSELVHELGERKASSDNEAKLQSAEKKKRPVAKSTLKEYVGYLVAPTGAVRELEHGILDVVHCPELNVKAHSEIVLRPDFVNRLRDNYRSEDIPGGGEIDAKNGRVIVRDKLVNLFCQRFVARGCVDADDRYDVTHHSASIIAR